MSDNTRLNPGAGGDLYAADELATINGAEAEPGLKVQQVKVGFGVMVNHPTLAVQTVERNAEGDILQTTTRYA